MDKEGKFIDETKSEIRFPGLSQVQNVRVGTFKETDSRR